MPPEVTALIFDCDGTLADTMPAHYLAWLDALQPHGIEFPEPRFYALGGVPTTEIAKLLVAGIVCSPDERAALAHALAEEKEQRFLLRFDEVRPVEKVVAIAREQFGQLPMAVASGGQREIVERTLSHLGIRQWFPVVVAAEDTRRHKPEPDVFLEAARRLGVAPGGCTVYEDTDLGLEAARRAGMLGVDIRKL